jgi:hypothetical protein
MLSTTKRRENKKRKGIKGLSGDYPLETVQKIWSDPEKSPTTKWSPDP